MFQIGEKVMYGVHGMCIVAAREEKRVDRKTATYLILEPIKRDGSRYMVPEDNPAAMAKLHKILTREEILELLDAQEVRSGQWIREENLRKQRYRELMAKGERLQLMQTVHCVYRHREAQAAAGKKFHLCDENFLRDAEKLLAEEISLVMDLDTNEARQLLRSKLQ